MADVHRLPTHQVKLFRAFCTAEAFELGAWLEAKPRPLRWLLVPFAGFGAAFKIYRYGKALGLPIRTMHRIAVQLDREWDSAEQGGREDDGA